MDKDVGFAFPSNGYILNGEDTGPHIERGMSLRDYFAAAALTGFLARGTVSNRVDASVTAYDTADAMLAERERSRAR